MQFDLANRVINQCSQEGEIVFDPFGGLFTVSYCCVPLKRRSISCELGGGYFRDGVAYVKAAEQKANAPTLFDMTDYMMPEDDSGPTDAGEFVEYTRQKLQNSDVKVPDND